MQSKNITEMCNALKNEYTRFYSFWGSFNPVSPERLKARVFRPRVFLWHRVLPISAKMEGILVSHQSTFPCKTYQAEKNDDASDGGQDEHNSGQLDAVLAENFNVPVANLHFLRWSVSREHKI